MQPEFPRVAVGLDHLGLAGHVRVVVVSDIALAHERLEVGAELHPVWRVHVDHLHLAAEALVVQQRVHDDEGVAEDQPIDPRIPVLVGPEHLIRYGTLWIAEQLEHAELWVRRFLAVRFQRLDDRLGAEPLVHEQR